MARMSISAGLIACLALTSLLNFATTCCCGDSLLLELVAESCGQDAHAHERERVDHHPGPLGGGHTCYKAGSSAFLEGTNGQPVFRARALASICLPGPHGPATIEPDLSATARPAADDHHRPPPRPARLSCWLL